MKGMQMVGVTLFAVGIALTAFGIFTPSIMATVYGGYESEVYYVCNDGTVVYADWELCDAHGGVKEGGGQNGGAWQYEEAYAAWRHRQNTAKFTMYTGLFLVTVVGIILYKEAH